MARGSLPGLGAAAPSSPSSLSVGMGHSTVRSSSAIDDVDAASSNGSLAALGGDVGDARGP